MFFPFPGLCFFFPHAWLSCRSVRVWSGVMIPQQLPDWSLQRTSNQFSHSSTHSAPVHRVHWCVRCSLFARPVHLGLWIPVFGFYAVFQPIILVTRITYHSPCSINSRLYTLLFQIWILRFNQFCINVTTGTTNGKSQTRTSLSASSDWDTNITICSVTCHLRKWKLLSKHSHALLFKRIYVNRRCY